MNLLDKIISKVWDNLFAPQCNEQEYVKCTLKELHNTLNWYSISNKQIPQERTDELMQKIARSYGILFDRPINDNDPPPVL